MLVGADGWGHTSEDIMGSVSILHPIVYTNGTEM